MQMLQRRREIADATLPPQRALGVDLATVNDDRLASDPTCGIARKEQGDVRHLLGGAQTAGWNALNCSLIQLRFLQLALLPGPARKFNRARRDRVYPNAIVREGQGLGLSLIHI